MRVEWDEVFPEMTPPQGGLDALRARLRAEAEDGGAGLRQRRHAAGMLRMVAVAASIVVAVVTLWVVHARASRPALDLAALSVGSASIRLGLVPAPTEPVSVPEADRGRVAIEQVETLDPNVLFYRVVVLSEPSRSRH